MGYQTILIYCGSDSRVKSLVNAGLLLAEKSQNVHIIGLHVIPQIPVYPDMAFMVTSELVDMQKGAFQESAKKIQSTFEHELHNSGVSWEWRCCDAGGKMLADRVLDHARCTDLVIAAQDNPDNSADSQVGVTEQVLMASGRPVLIIPYAGEFNSIGENIMIAWNASREATRATFDALPVLQSAASVNVVWVNAKDEYNHDIDLPGSEIALTLARHNVKANALKMINPDISFADELLSQVSDQGADLLVMGSYGHSRVREFVFGGVTRDILQHMTVPVLMSH